MTFKSPKLSRQWIRKRYYKTIRTSVINSPMSPPSLVKIAKYRPKMNINVYYFVKEFCGYKVEIDRTIYKYRLFHL